MKLDLHVHSHASDGRASPAEVVAAAEAAGLDVIALTDHDTCTGLPAARAAAEGRRLQVVPGIEVSTREPEGEFHILGYFVDPDSEAVQRHQQLSSVRRAERMERMVERLQRLGVPITLQDVIGATDVAPASLGRPHLARAMMAAGLVRTFGEAFDRFLRDDAPGFVRTEFPRAEEAIELIHAAGGMAVWAHPPLDLFDAVIGRFAGQGIDGVECFRPMTAPADAEHLRAAAADHGLIATGGSDWHGVHHGSLGQFSVSDLLVPEIAARCGA